jgi:hypothetical protein
MSEPKKMAPEWKQKWIEALRSGKYEQGESRLRSVEDCYCCLGVLCDLVDPNGWLPATGGTCYDHISQYASGYPTGNVYNAAELDPQVAGVLANMNDTGKSFEEIASYIERHL